MQEYRLVSNVYEGKVLLKDKRTRLVRYLGPNTEISAAPFLLMESIHLNTASEFADGFPWRPYEGVEAIWYFTAAAGKLRRAHTLMSEAHWVALANGAITEKIPDLGGPEIGTQLWVGLPESMAHNHIEVPAHMDATVINPAEGVWLRIISGTYDGAAGILKSASPSAVYFDVYMDPHASWEYEDAGEGTMLIFVTEGEAAFGPYDDEIYEEERALLMSDGQKLCVKSTHLGVRFLLLHAPVKDGPILDMHKVHKSEAHWVELLKQEVNGAQPSEDQADNS